MMNPFFWSHTLLVAQQGGYGRLYNWYCTQTQYTKVKYGYLYTQYAAIDNRNIAASNAHVPSNTECQALITYLGGSSVAGGKLKEIGFIHWYSPNTGATNSSEFNAYGSGSRDPTDGIFYSLGGNFAMHSSSIYSAYGSEGIFIFFNSASATGWNASGNATFTAKTGASVRLIVDSPIEINGNSAIYVGNDGRRYKCVLINSVWWLAENLAETKYRNGDLIPVVTDNTAWSALTTGARCAYDNDEANAFETASIAPAGWHVPSIDEWFLLMNALGGQLVAGGKLKEIGTIHWLNPNTGATNESNFTSTGGGIRGEDSFYVGLKENSNFWSSTIARSGYSYEFSMYFNNPYVNYSASAPYKYGHSIRFVKDDSEWSVGDTVTDYDGNVYPTCKIGTQVWMAENLKVTKLNDGTPIPLIEDNTAWAAQTSMAQCIYGNDPKNL